MTTVLDSGLEVERGEDSGLEEHLELEEYSELGIGRGLNRKELNTEVYLRGA